MNNWNGIEQWMAITNMAVNWMIYYNSPFRKENLYKAANDSPFDIYSLNR